MTRPVVARGAEEGVGAQEDRSGGSGEIVVAVLNGAVALEIAQREVRGGDLVVVARAGNQLARHHVVRLVRADRSDEVAVEKVATRRAEPAAVGEGRRAVEVVHEESPAIHEGIGGEQGVDLPRALVAGAIVQEGRDRGRVRDPAGEVERDATQELGVARKRGGMDAVGLHFPQDLVVDEVGVPDVGDDPALPAVDDALHASGEGARVRGGEKAGDAGDRAPMLNAVDVDRSRHRAVAAGS